MPRWLRHDAVLAMSELLMRLDEHWRVLLAWGEDLVFTINGDMRCDVGVISSQVFIIQSVDRMQNNTRQYMHARPTQTNFHGTKFLYFFPSMCFFTTNTSLDISVLVKEHLNLKFD